MVNTEGGKPRREYYKWTEAYSFSLSDFTELLCQQRIQTGSTNMPAGLPRASSAHQNTSSLGRETYCREAEVVRQGLQTFSSQGDCS